ncbi:MAG TPA: flagellar motor switch phosphatase FliY [Spirochaetota bacterium]|nr:flagellar motor switch phosphatase FliY [Spirochaetota bacterium]HPP03768.1 flagellar motor switch phosphatase FliY [Spirochaetota bacterium]
MGDGALSQDEIDALLNEGEDSLSSGGFDLGGGESLSSLLSQNDINTFIDLVNSASGNMGGALGALLGRTVAISNPKVEVISGSNIINQLDPQIVEIVMDYESGAIGQHSYLLDLEVSKAIAGLMVGQESVELTEMTLGAVSEAMNVICGNSSNTIGTKSKKELRTSPPKVEIKSKNNLSLKANENYVKVIYDFNIEGKPLSQLIEIFGLNVIKEIISSIMPVSNMAGGNNTKMMNQQQNMGMPNQMMGMPNMGMPNQMMGMPNMGMPNQMMGMPNMGMPNMGMPNQMMGMQNTQFQTVQFSSFGNQPTDVPGNNINLLMDVNMELTVELGRTRKPIKEILGMGEGTVIELDKLAGEPVDILVNGRLIARGEVVVIDESFGVRVTEIVDPKDRIK